MQSYNEYVQMHYFCWHPLYKDLRMEHISAWHTLDSEHTPDPWKPARPINALFVCVLSFFGMMNLIYLIDFYVYIYIYTHICACACGFLEMITIMIIIVSQVYDA